MRRFAPLLMLGVGLAVLVPSLLVSVDRGAFDRTPVGREGAHWGRALGTGGDGGSLGEADAYDRVLSLAAADELGAVQEARRRQGAILLPLLAVLLFLLARPHTGDWAAVFSGLLGAASAPVVLGATAIAPALPAAILALAGLLILDRRRDALGFAAAGAGAGLAASLVPTLGWSLAVLLAVLAIVRPGRGRRAWALLALGIAWLGGAAGGAAAGAGSFPLVPGVEAYRGHREAASGVSPRRADPDEGRWWSLADFQRGAIRAADGRSLTESEVQSHWWKRSLEEAVRHPLSEMRRGLLHLLSSFQADPLPRDVSTAYLLERADRGGLAAVVWLTRILLPLGLIGFWIGRRNLSGPILVAGLSGLAAATLTYADPDSRLVTVAALAIGAGLFAHAMATGSRRARWTGLALVVPAVLLWGLWPARGGVPGMEVQAEDAFFLGALYDQEQRGSVAQREYDRALRMDPDNPLPRFALAGMLARDQLYERASEELERLVERHPRFYPGLLMLARLYEQQQRWPEGAQVYLGLLQLEPWNPELHNNYATLMVQMGLYEQATAALQTALRIDPDYTLARENLEGLRNMGLAPGTGVGGDPLRSAQEGVLARLREGNTAAAEDSLQAAYGRFGEIPSLVYLEGILRLSQGRPREAIDLFQPMYDERKSDPMFLNNLGSAYAEGGELEEARKVWEEALRLQPDNYRIQRNLLRIQAVMDSLEASPED